MAGGGVPRADIAGDGHAVGGVSVQLGLRKFLPQLLHIVAYIGLRRTAYNVVDVDAETVDNATTVHHLHPRFHVFVDMCLPFLGADARETVDRRHFRMSGAVDLVDLDGAVCRVGGHGDRLGGDVRGGEGEGEAVVLAVFCEIINGDLFRVGLTEGIPELDGPGAVAGDGEGAAPFGLEPFAVLLMPRPRLHRADRLIEGHAKHCVAAGDGRLHIIDRVAGAADAARVAEGVRGRDGKVHGRLVRNLGEHALYRHIQIIAAVEAVAGEIGIFHRRSGVDARGMAVVGRPCDIRSVVGEGECVFGIRFVEGDIHSQAVLHGALIVADAELQGVGAVAVIREFQAADAVILVVGSGPIVEPWGALGKTTHLAESAVGADGDDLVVRAVFL